MATKKVLVQISVEQTGKGATGAAKDVDKLTKATDRLNAELSEEAQNLAFINEQTSRARKSNKDLAKAQVDAANSTKGLNDNLQEMKTTAGLSGAIVTEFGRTISDLPYGIRGVGNNLSQLGTLFGLFATNVTKSGRTMADGFKELFNQFKGIIGIMTAFQVVIALLQSEWFQKWSAGLFKLNGSLTVFKDLMQETSEIAGKSIGNFKLYTDVLLDANSSLREQGEAIKLLNKEYPDFNASILEDKDNTELAKTVRDQYIVTLKEQALTQAAMSEFQKSQTIIIQKELEKEQEARELGFASLEELQNKIISEQERVDKIGSERLKTRESQLLNNLKRVSEIGEEEIKEEEKKQKILQDLITLRADSENGRGSIRRGFRSRLLNLATLAEKFRQDSLKGEIKSDEELIAQKAEFSRQDLAIKLKNFEETEKLRLKEFLKTKNLSKKQIDDAKESSRVSIQKSKDDSKEVLENIQLVYDAEINLLRRKRGEEARIDQEKMDRIESLKGLDRGTVSGLGVTDESISEQNLRIQNEIDYQKRLLDATEEGTLERSEAEQRYFDAKRDRLDSNLEAESYAINESTRINQIYISYLQGLSGVLSALAGENKELQLTALALEKGSAIAGVVIEANKSIATRTAKNAALLPPLQAADAGFMAKDIIRTKVSAGIAIAGITATGISQAGGINSGGSSGSGGATTVQPPDFNIIGSNGVNQLADAIGSTEQKPVQAYVTATQVTTVQALQRNNRKNGEV